MGMVTLNTGDGGVRPVLELENSGSKAVKQLFTIGVFVVITCPATKPESSEEILLVQQQRDGKWSLPGGGLEDDEFPTECGAREVFEESGLVVKILNEEYIGTAILRKTQKPHDEVHLFYGRVLDNSGFLPNGNGEETIKCAFWPLWMLENDEDAAPYRPDIYSVQWRLIQRFIDWQISQTPFFSEPQKTSRKV